MKNPSLLRKHLAQWFHQNRRDLPWRRDRTPYAAWISEIMLQQTQVKTMLPYFNRWMKEVPTIKALSGLDEHKLFGLWQGLGYYSRAKNLKKGAQFILENFNGEVPTSYEDLIRIPGIGQYTAGAILSIAFNKKAPIVDGNVLRVISRLYALHDPIDEEKTKRKIYDLQSALVPQKEPGVFNEALMELGALVCAPKNPSCPACPLSTFCMAYQRSIQNDLPVKNKKTVITKVDACAVILKKDKKFFIHKRPEGQIMGGMWEFPEWKLNSQPSPRVLSSLPRSPRSAKRASNIDIEQASATLISNHLQLKPETLKFLKSIKRHYTRYAETLRIFEADVKTTPPALNADWPHKWVSASELDTYPLTSAHAKIRQIASTRNR